MVDVQKLNGKILCTDDGSGVLIMGIKLKEERRATSGELKVRMTVGGNATAYLNNASDAQEGVQVLDEPYVCEESVDLEAEDKKLFLDKLNRGFGINPPLVDDGDDVLFRLSEEGDAYQQIVGKKAYFKFNLKAGSENSSFGPTVYTNIYSVPIKTNATTDALKETLARLSAKKAEKEREEKAKAKALAEAMG